MVERILAAGPQGSGKTFQALRLAQWLQPTGAQFYILDTDDSYERSLLEFPGLSNVHVTFAYDWQDYIRWLEQVLATVVAGKDWLVVDRADKAWNRVQHYLSEEVYGQSLADRLVEARKRMYQKIAMVVSANDQADWQVINANYLGWFMGVMYKSRCHVYLTAAVTPVRSDDEQDIRNVYGPLGVKPEGQKSLPYEPHTVFLFHFDKTTGKRKITTIKDRARPYFQAADLVHLGLQYLRQVAGWQLNG
jgi:hypothetical protein